MSCHIMGVHHPVALQHAKSLGIAMQLTNIVRDFRTDCVDLNRCYVPKHGWKKLNSNAGF